MAIGLKTTAVVTVGTTAITAGVATEAQSIIISTAGANSSTVYIGSSTVTVGSNCAVALTNGQSYTFTVADGTRPGFSQLNLNKFYLCGGAAGQIVYIGYLERGG